MFDLENARYRTTFVGAENEMLTQKSRKLDYIFLLEYITRLYLKYPALFEDEYVQNRVGLKKFSTCWSRPGGTARCWTWAAEIANCSWPWPNWGFP